MIKKKKQKKKIVEVMSVVKEDRRMLSNVPDPDNIRHLLDRRGVKRVNIEEQEVESEYLDEVRLFSIRYIADFDVILTYKESKIIGKAVDISSSGILIEFDENTELMDQEKYHLKFILPAGTMPEGFESKVKIIAKAVRVFKHKNDSANTLRMALEFEDTLINYLKKRRWGFSVYFASSLLFLISFVVILMRVESIIYFRYNKLLYFYSIVAAAFLLTRYLFGAFYRNVPINKDFTPGVSIIVPCFNEEKWIDRTIISCINQDYPIEQLEVIIVDDCSSDKSVQRIKQTLNVLNNEAERYQAKERLKFIPLPQNSGKRIALVKGVEVAKHDLVVFVDSDSFLEPSAIRHLVQPFQDPKMGGVTGRTDVENKFTNAVTKMQAVRYYVAFRIMKAAEAYFDSVTCLSGPLSCYKKSLVVKYSEDWLNQKFFGQPATFGDDRSMTNFILRYHRTSYQDNAICSTIVPSDGKVFLKQQMRWKRSWLRESLRAASFIWRKEPFMALSFYIGFIIPIAAPVVVIYNFIYVPLVYRIFPTTFILGLVLMSLLMSFAHLFFKKSKLWLFGLVFCVYYQFVLLWQMPVAWVTFWKSTWGTRETKEDVEYKLKKRLRKNRWKKWLPDLIKK